MSNSETVRYQDTIGRMSHVLRPNEASDYDPLIDAIGDARFVLLGEASHGTHEFYRERAEITKRLILEKGFSAVAVEADFPDAYRVNRYIRAESEDEDAVEALSGFRRFPAWMWRNADVLDFVGWLREYNDQLASLAPNSRRWNYADVTRRAGCRSVRGLEEYQRHKVGADAVSTELRHLQPQSVRRQGNT